jgi:hypothetical protein
MAVLQTQPAANRAVAVELAFERIAPGAAFVVRGGTMLLADALKRIGKKFSYAADGDSPGSLRVPGAYEVTDWLEPKHVHWVNPLVWR